MDNEIKNTCTFQVVTVLNDLSITMETKEFTKINHAVRYLWKRRNIREGYLCIIEKNQYGFIVSNQKLLMKIGRRRGIYSQLTQQTADTKARPLLKKAGDGWHRLPNRFNDIV